MSWEHHSHFFLASSIIITRRPRVLSQRAYYGDGLSLARKEVFSVGVETQEHEPMDRAGMEG